MEGSFCIHSPFLPVPSVPSVVIYDINIAKSQCSSNIECIGIQYTNEWSKSPDTGRYFECRYGIYKSTAWDKYKNFTTGFLRKANSHGKHIHPVENW